MKEQLFELLSHQWCRPLVLKVQPQDWSDTEQKIFTWGGNLSVFKTMPASV